MKAARHACELVAAFVLGASLALLVGHAIEFLVALVTGGAL